MVIKSHNSSCIELGLGRSTPAEHKYLQEKKENDTKPTMTFSGSFSHVCSHTYYRTYAIRPSRPQTSLIQPCALLNQCQTKGNKMLHSLPQIQDGSPCQSETHAAQRHTSDVKERGDWGELSLLTSLIKEDPCTDGEITIPSSPFAFLSAGPPPNHH